MSQKIPATPMTPARIGPVTNAAMKTNPIVTPTIAIA